MTADLAKNQNILIKDVWDRSFTDDLFMRLREIAWDGVGVTREAYSERECQALDLVEEKGP